MVDLLQEFDFKSIPLACEFLTNYCNAYIITAAVSMQRVRSLLSALPGIITAIFGGPSARGWTQTEIPADHTTAIRRALRFDGAFLKALLHLSDTADLSYDVDTEKLSEDVCTAVAAGAIQYLPRVYTKCAYFEKRVGIGTSDIQTSATRQSTIFPRSVSGEHKIKFNVIQFFLYCTVLVPCTVSSSTAFQSRPPSVLATTTTATTSTTASTISSANSSFAASRSGSSTSSTNTLSNQPLQHAQAPRSRSIIGSAYEQLIEEYIRYFIACEPGADFHPTVGSFFLDACIELWVRTPYVASGQKLNVEQMHFVTTFVKYIVSCDLRRCHKGDQTHYRMVYKCIKTELYGLISRLALNWSKDDDYLQIISLRAIWTAPWRLGSAPRFRGDTHQPIAEGWSYHLMNIGLCYFSLTETFLQRIATFTYPDKPPQAAPFSHFHTQPLVTTLASAPNRPNNGGQLRITWCLINVFKTEGVVEFLGDIERGLILTQADAAPTGGVGNSQAVDAIAAKYFGDQKSQVQNSLKMTYDDFVQLGVAHGGLPTCTSTKAIPGLVRLSSGPHNHPSRQHASTTGRDGSGWWSTAHFFYTAETIDASHLHVEKERADSAGGLQKGGFLTDQERELIRQESFSSSVRTPADSSAKSRNCLAVLQTNVSLVCIPFPTWCLRPISLWNFFSVHENIPILGPRGQEVVRSYELAFMVRWTLPFDWWMNSHYLRYRPSSAAFFPETLTYGLWLR